jgi:hypothetical protein
MFLIRLLPIARTGRDGSDKEKGRTSSAHSRWRMFMDWLLEPIPFPGKTYHLDPDWANEKRQSSNRQAYNTLASLSVTNQ